MINVVFQRVAAPQFSRWVIYRTSTHWFAEPSGTSEPIELDAVEINRDGEVAGSRVQLKRFCDHVACCCNFISYEVVLPIRFKG